MLYFTDINQSLDNFGSTFLILAASKGDSDAVNHLLLQGADINICDIFGRSAIDAAYYNGHNDLANHIFYHNHTSFSNKLFFCFFSFSFGNLYKLFFRKINK